jgi:predicted CXXCH cytochrome family protein
MTGYDAGYNPATDTFHPKWIEQGVGCVQCHGTPPAGHGRAGAPAFDHFRADRQKMMQTCAPCHARNEPLTGSFKPGDLYHDHYRVTLPVQPGLFYPDGQQRDEVFNWTSVLTSRMGHAGVSCLDCHDPHTNKPILPVQNNALCMQCHSTPGRVMPGGTRAQVIDPLSHSRHAEGSAGNSCVACHMPTTNYMERAPRHDHGWLKPDPLLTKELGIPNSCSKCHEKEGIDWVIAKADEWYGPKLDSRQRARARAIAAAQARDPASVGLLLSLLKDEDIPAWRATYLDLLAPAGAEAEVRSSLERALGASDPLERSSAVRGLSRFPAARPLLRPLLADPVRLVRLDAALTLTDELPAESGLRRELDAYLALSLDQPSGLTRFGLDLANRGRLDEAVVHVSRAVAWDATSPDMFETLAQLELARRRPAAAAARFAESARLAPTEAVRSFHAALAYAEAGLGSEAEGQLREAIRRDPGLARAWYNLGLLLARRGASADALAALAGAEKAAPGDADYPYATATILWQSGRHEDARNAARRALALNPEHQPALQILRLKP